MTAPWSAVLTNHRDRFQQLRDRRRAGTGIARHARDGRVGPAGLHMEKASRGHTGVIARVLSESPVAVFRNRYFFDSAAASSLAFVACAAALSW